MRNLMGYDQIYPQTLLRWKEEEKGEGGKGGGGKLEERYKKIEVRGGARGRKRGGEAGKGSNLIISYQMIFSSITLCHI